MSEQVDALREAQMQVLRRYETDHNVRLAKENSKNWSYNLSQKDKRFLNTKRDSRPLRKHRTQKLYVTNTGRDKTYQSVFEFYIQEHKHRFEMIDNGTQSMHTMMFTFYPSDIRKFKLEKKFTMSDTKQNEVRQMMRELLRLIIMEFAYTDKYWVYDQEKEDHVRDPRYAFLTRVGQTDRHNSHSGDKYTINDKPEFTKYVGSGTGQDGQMFRGVSFGEDLLVLGLNDTLHRAQTGQLKIPNEMFAIYERADDKEMREEEWDSDEDEYVLRVYEEPPEHTVGLDVMHFVLDFINERLFALAAEEPEKGNSAKLHFAKKVGWPAPRITFAPEDPTSMLVRLRL